MEQSVHKASLLFDELPDVKFKRLHGQVDSDSCSILPSKVAEIDNLQSMKNQVRYCSRGLHSSFRNTCLKVICEVITHVAGVVLNG